MSGDTNNGNGNDKEQSTEKFELMKSGDRANALSNEDSMFLNVAKFEQMQRVATMLSRSDFVPSRFRNNVGNCMIALDMASLMQMHPVMLMRTMYIVHGEPGFEGKFISALINNSGRYADPLEYEWKGKQGSPDWGCRAFAKRKSTGKVVHGPWITWQLVESEGWNKKQGSKWVSMPEIMFQYRAVAFFGRAYDSDLLLGMKTVDELQDIHADLQRQPDGSYAADRRQAYLKADAIDTGTYDVTGSPPEPEKQAEQTDPHSDDFGMAVDHPLAKKNWFSMRQGSPKDGTGFGAFVETHKNLFNDLTPAAWAAMEEKHNKLYGEPLSDEIQQIYNGQFKPDAEPDTEQTVVETEPAPAPEPEPELDLFQTEVGKQLYRLIEKWPDEAGHVIRNRIPNSEAQIMGWIDRINQMVVDKQGGPPVHDGDPGPTESWE